MKKSPKGDSCQLKTCDAFQLVGRIRRGEDGVEIGPEQLEHLRVKHIAIWGEFGWWYVQVLKQENARIEEEKKKLKVESTRVANGEPPVADPRNHVEGFCDAIVAAPNGTVLKCTDHARYGSNRCGFHQKALYVLGVKK